jgi:uncharacterized membrane protein YfcA
MNSAAGFAGYLGRVDLDWRFLAAFTAVSMAGALVGTALARRVPPHMLRRVFAVFLLVISGYILYQNRVVLAGGPAAGGVAAR